MNLKVMIKKEHSNVLNSVYKYYTLTGRTARLRSWQTDLSFCLRFLSWFTFLLLPTTCGLMWVDIVCSNTSRTRSQLVLFYVNVYIVLKWLVRGIDLQLNRKINLIIMESTGARGTWNARHMVSWLNKIQFNTIQDLDLDPRSV